MHLKFFRIAISVNLKIQFCVIAKLHQIFSGAFYSERPFINLYSNVVDKPGAVRKINSSL